MAGARRNLELKAVDRDPAGSRQACERLGAEDIGTLDQEDTYFEVPRGRLKLRRERGAPAHLIAYERSDDAGRRESRYRIVAVKDDAGLEAALAGALGVRAVVRKARRLFLHEGVRVHLDLVEGLGSFVELEGVCAPGADLGRLEASLGELRRALTIDDADLIAGSYCDLVLALP
jgi:predicted adenylyl cyclase CyaB